jgi:hypothetical protein
MRKKVFIASGVILLVALGVFFFVVPGCVGRQMNITLNPPPYEASGVAKEWRQRLLVADLHADTLMWDRDLLERGGWGHVDVPRLVEGNVAVLF